MLICQPDGPLMGINRNDPKLEHVISDCNNKNYLESRTLTPIPILDHSIFFAHTLETTHEKEFESDIHFKFLMVSNKFPFGSRELDEIEARVIKNVLLKQLSSVPTKIRK